LYWWHTFLLTWNGLSILRHPSVLLHPNCYAKTDASGLWGCAAVLGSHWLQWHWPSQWRQIGIMAKELVPIIFTCIVWGPHLSRQQINFQCDNTNLVVAINKGASKDKFVMHLLRSLSFFIANFDIHLTATHLPGIVNVTADHLSHGNTYQASQLNAESYYNTPSAFKLVSPHQIAELCNHPGLPLSSMIEPYH